MRAAFIISAKKATARFIGSDVRAFSFTRSGESVFCRSGGVLRVYNVRRTFSYGRDRTTAVFFIGEFSSLRRRRSSARTLRGRRSGRREFLWPVHDDLARVGRTLETRPSLSSPRSKAPEKRIERKRNKRAAYVDFIK